MNKSIKVQVFKDKYGTIVSYRERPLVEHKIKKAVNSKPTLRIV